MSLRNKILKLLYPNIGDIIVLEKYQSIYFAIPKVANTSLKLVCAHLLHSKRDSSLVQQTDWPTFFRDVKSARILRGRGKGILIKKRHVREYKEFWKFCFVRNPWDRLVSCFKEKVDRYSKDDFSNWSLTSPGFSRRGFYPGMSFEEFGLRVCELPDALADRHFKSQYLFLTDWKERLLVDYVGHFENLEEDFSYVLRKMGLGKIELPHVSMSHRKRYQDYYSPKLIKIVGRRYRKDIGFFRYSF